MFSHVLFWLLASASLTTSASPAPAPATPLIRYTIAMPDPASHLYDVSIDVSRLRGPIVRLQMPVWSPGRYARMDFAKNVQDFSVTDSAGRPVRWDRENGSLWRLYLGSSRKVLVRYKVFGDNLSGTFSVLDSLHANWNGPSIFMYVDGRKAEPVTLHITPPTGWHVINGDTRKPDQLDYEFENYDRLVDTPTEVAPSFSVDTFNVDGRVYRVVVHHNGPTTDAERARFVADVRKIVTSHNHVIGPPPLSMYTFLVHAGFPGGDGMEHLYSTQIITSQAWTDTAKVLPGVTTAAHEYFHTWNMKRIRALALGPFDYAHEQYQPSLWVGEGWTQYYGQMVMLRGGITDRASLYSVMGGVVQANLTAPGRKEVSARMSSFEAPFFDGAPRGQNTNRAQTFFSYYTKGSGLALALDLMIRDATSNAHSLDDALRALKHLSWDQPRASYYLQGRGYTEADVERAVSQAIGKDMHPWFERYVGGTDDVPFDDLLARVGVRVDRSTPHWTLADIPNATERQVMLRKGWLTDAR